MFSGCSSWNGALSAVYYNPFFMPAIRFSFKVLGEEKKGLPFPRNNSHSLPVSYTFSLLYFPHSSLTPSNDGEVGLEENGLTLFFSSSTPFPILWLWPIGL
jgi:hypothetical protein